MKRSAVLFDLDGTLLDTLNDIAFSMNAALTAFGAPPHTLPEYRRFVGEGLDTLAFRALPLDRRDKETVERCITAMRSVYASTWARTTKPYDGIDELLAELHRRDIRCAVLSNKAHEFTKAIVDHFFGKAAFELVLGAGTLPKKPDPAGALYIAKTFGLAPEKFLYVGDSDVDMKTATGAGMFPLAVLWGFRSKEELLASGAMATVERPPEILGYLEG
jgi:phosphoglycolate phosphatase